MEPTAIDLDGLAAILVIHPAGITPETEYLLDQYLLQGGTIVAALDAFSLTAQQIRGGNRNPLNPQQGIATTSAFSKNLFESWGVNFISDQVLSDGNYRTRFQRGESTSALTLTKEAFPQKDNIITDNLNELFFALVGAFSTEGKDGLSHTSLIRSSTKSGFVDGNRASQLDPSLLGSATLDDKAYDLAMHIQGNFKTAFPDGDPTKQDNKTEELEEGTPAAEAAAAEKEDPQSDESQNPSLLKSTKPGNIFLIADCDFLADGFAYQQVFGGIFSPANDNAALLFNIVDQVTGSKHLIGSRSRNDSRRPFTVIQEMESDFEQEFGDKRAEKQEELQKIITRRNELLQDQQKNGQIILEGAAKEEHEKAVAKEVEARKELRELEKGLRRKKDKLTTQYILANTLIVPLAVIFLGLCVLAKRRFSTSAR